jgi:hypothetical protein
MIWESAYWKEELFRNANRLKRRQGQQRWVERSHSCLEKDVMIGFYSIRKLIESHKISDELRDRQVPLIAYPWTGRDVTFMNWDKIDQNYDLEGALMLHQPVVWLANKLVHSFVFMASCNENGGLKSILFNSDQTRRKYLYEIGIEQLIAIFEDVAANDPALMNLVFNKKTGDYDITIGPTMEPPETGA